MDDRDAVSKSVAMAEALDVGQRWQGMNGACISGDAIVLFST